ncbi:MAG: peptidyl-prolyl cis-trans isomerase [Phycisphaerae bacterium]|nr:peptidyl-prolyl cis-trans isomerase [Phycisphaerae bacterium]
MRTSAAIIIVSMLTGTFGCGMFNMSPPESPLPDPPSAPTTQPVNVANDNPAPTTRSASGEVMAVVNGKIITMDQLHTILVDGYGLAISQDILRGEIVRQAASSKGITVSDKEVSDEHERAMRLTFSMANSDAERQQMLNQLLMSRNVTYSTWRLIMRRNALLRKMIGTDFEVPDAAVRAAFDKRHGRMVVVSHIETKSHVAAKLVKSLAATRNFAVLAKEYSVNPTGRTGGTLPPIGKDTKQVSPALKQVALAMTKIGEISDPVQVASRFHILKLEKIIEPKKVKYTDDKDKIAAELKEQMIRSAGNRLLEKLSEAADVKFINPSLKTQLQQRADKKP